MANAEKPAGSALTHQSVGLSCELPFRGVVLYLVPERNYGIIQTADGLEIYFLRSSVINNTFDVLELGSPVHFNLGSGILGLQARQVLLDHLSPWRH